MTAVTTARPQLTELERATPRPAGFVADVTVIAGRALRAIPRDLESVIPPVFIALFFFLVNVGTLRVFRWAAILACVVAVVGGAWKSDEIAQLSQRLDPETRIINSALIAGLDS